MQITNKQKGTLVFSLLFMFIMLYITFDNKAVFW